MGRHATPRKGNGRKNGAPGWAWLLAGLTVGLFVALLVYLQGERNTEHKLRPIPREEPKSIDTSVNKKKKEEETGQKPAKPRFDFYTILPEMEVPVPEPEPAEKHSSATRSQKGNAPKKEKPLEPGAFYVLQLGSFRNRADADRLKAKIAMLGFEPHIQTVNINGSNWYRVRVGPYNNSLRIAEVRHRLHEAQLESILLKLKE